MGEELDAPIKTYSPKDNENNYLKYGLNQVQGWKKSMEDYAIDFTDPDKENFLNVFGIFDGHGGREVPKYLQVHFMDYLKKNTNFQNGKFKDALRDTFFEVDKSFTTEEAQKKLTQYSEELKPSKEQEIKDINNLCGQGEKLNQEELEQIMAFNEVFDPRNIENANIAEFTGATGIILFLGDKNIYIANAGNSRCLVLDKEGKIVNSTKDHTMNVPEEKKRVELARSFNEEEEKKKGEEQGHAEYLDSTRGFGDWEFKGNEWIDQKDQEVSVEPDILEVPMDNAQYLIMGSHGMFESGTNDNENDDFVNTQISSFFYNEITKNKDKPYSKIIEEYFVKLIPDKNDGNNTKGLDNMSCIVVNLKNDNIKVFIKKREAQLEEKKRKEEEEKRKKKEEDAKRRAEELKKKQEEKKKAEEEKNKKPDEIKKNADKPYSKIIEEYFEKIIPDKNDGNNIKGLDNMSCIVVNLKNEPISAYIEKKEIEEKERKKKEEEEKKRKKEEERKKREEERKKKEEEKKKKEEAKKQVEEPKKEEPKIEEPKKEEPKIEEPKKEEVKNEEPKVEEPKKEEPKNEEPKKDEESKKDEEPKKEEVKIEEDKKEENKNEIKEENNNEIKEEKNEINEENKNEIKEEKNEIKEENKDEIKEENKNEINEDKKEEKKEENEIKPQEEEKNNEAQ